MEIGQVFDGFKTAFNATAIVLKRFRINLVMSDPCSLCGKVGRPVKTQDGKILVPVYIDLSDPAHRITIHKIKASGTLYQALGDGTEPNNFILGSSYGSKEIECGETVSKNDYGKWFMFFIEATGSYKVKITFVFGIFSSMTYSATVPH